MLYKKIISLLLILNISVAQAAKCLLAEALKNPQLASNEQFWKEYSQLADAGNASDKELEALLKKYNATLENQTSQAPVLKPSMKISIKPAEKEISKLPSHLREKVEEFLKTVSGPDGIQEIHNNPGRWHLEKTPQFGPNAHTIRLNDGYRVMFDIEPDQVTVRMANKGKIHSN